MHLNNDLHFPFWLIQRFEEVALWAKSYSCLRLLPLRGENQYDVPTFSGKLVCIIVNKRNLEKWDMIEYIDGRS
jgi:hypothetical protein